MSDLKILGLPSKSFGLSIYTSLPLDVDWLRPLAFANAIDKGIFFLLRLIETGLLASPITCTWLKELSGRWITSPAFR